MIRHAALYLAFRVCNGLVALLALYLLSRLMPPSQYGEYLLGLSVVGAVAVLGFQWLNVSMGRFHTRERTVETDQRLAAAHQAWAILSVTALLALPTIGAAGWVPHLGPGSLAVAATGGAGIALHALHLQLLNAEQLPMRYGWLGSSRSIGALAGALAGYELMASPVAALAGSVVGTLGAVLAFGYPGGLRSLAQPWQQSSRLVHELVRFGLPLSLTYISVTALDITDRLMISSWLGSAALAPYSATFDLCQQTLAALLGVLYLAGYPRIIRAWETNGAPAAREATRPLQLGILLMAPCLALIFTTAAPEICALVFGSPLQKEAADILPWITLAVIFSTTRAFLFDVALHVQKAVRLHVVTTTLMAATNITLNIALIPNMGTRGAAIASSAAFGLGMLTSLWFGRGLRLFTAIGTQLIKAIICTIGAATILHFTNAELPAPPLARLILKTCIAITAFACGALILKLIRLDGLAAVAKRILRG